MTEGSQAAARPIRSGLAEILSGRDFRLLWGGEFVSLLGSQFFVVALPWLVYRLTKDALAIGAILAVGAAPRTVFILVGGVLTDRFDSRRVMLYSNLARMALVAVLALLTVLGLVNLWMLYAFSFLLGLGYALYLPAQSAMIPRLVSDHRLQIGNAVIQGTAQLSVVLGPAIAGVLIWLLGQKGGGGAVGYGGIGIGIAFALNAGTFLVSGVTLGLIRMPSSGVGDEYGPAGAESVVHKLAEGIAYVWRDRTLRLYFVLIGAVNLALLGPLSVGIPVLAATRFAGGSMAYGSILSGLGAGALAGVVAGGTLRKPPGRGFAVALLGSVVVLGVGMALMGVFTSAAAVTGASFLVGVAEGYLTIVFITWLQRRTSRHQLGRMMSILLFASVGQAPVSNVVAGVLIRQDASLVMLGAGALIVLVAGVAALSPAVWQLSENGAPPEAGPPS